MVQENRTQGFWEEQKERLPWLEVDAGRALHSGPRVRSHGGSWPSVWEAEPSVLESRESGRKSKGEAPVILTSTFAKTLSAPNTWLCTITHHTGQLGKCLFDRRNCVHTYPHSSLESETASVKYVTQLDYIIDLENSSTVNSEESMIWPHLSNVRTSYCCMWSK